MPTLLNYKDAETSEERKNRVDPDGVLDKVCRWHSKSKADLTMYQERWAQNLKLMKGVWDSGEKTRSEVRGRSKLFFRKVWSTVWRLLAAMYNAFLRDPDQVRLAPETSDPVDAHRAGVLLELVNGYKRKMDRTQNLFLQQVWGFYNALTYGLGVGLLSWEYDKSKKIDGPRFKVFEPERVFPDMTASLESEMEYIIFESFHSLAELRARGYENLDELESSTTESSTLRSVRHLNTQDPVQNPGENEYPRPGRYAGAENGKKPDEVHDKIKVWQVFYREMGKIYYCVTAGDQVILKKPELSKYGDVYPTVMGVCLTEPHKLIGEGFPEPLEGPQVSLNDVINRRKDNVSLALNKHSIVSRYGNVDLGSLMNSRAGGITLADDVNAVREREMGDVTQSAYVEAQADEGMMQEMSGVTPAKAGLEKAAKATTAQINLTESNAKFDFFIALIGESWMKSFYQKLTYMVQRFHTDKKKLQVATQSYRQKNKLGYDALPTDMNNVDEFDADVIVDVGIGTAGRENSIRETMLAMDRAVQANQSMIQLISTGAVPQRNLKLFDTSKFMEQLLPKIGYKNVQDYFIEVSQPPPEQGSPGGGRAIAAAAGAMQPQLRGGQLELAQSLLGGNGGINV